MLGLTARPGSPDSALGLSPRHFFAFLEGFAREVEGRAQYLDDLYEAAKRTAVLAHSDTTSAEEARYLRRQQIASVQNLFGG